ncbi:MAG: amidase [Cyanobacteria bacterium]|nr:amidase [Cyanobacteriota bacterium]
MSGKRDARRFGIIEQLDLQLTNQGRLIGKTFVAKDLIDVKDHMTGFGSPEWSSRQTPASRSAEVVDLLLSEGARLVGKSLTDEIACSLDGINLHYGTPENSQLPGKIPGGSSSGSAAAVAAGLCDFSLGTDTAGSTRVPASYCGLYGIRPTHGLVSLEGVRPLGPSFDTLGWMSGNAELLEICGSVLLGLPQVQHPLDSICILDSVFDDTQSEVCDALKTAAHEISGLFKNKSHSYLSSHAANILMLVFNTIRSREAWGKYGEWIEKEQPNLSKAVRNRLEEGKSISAEDDRLARELKLTSTQYLDELVARHGVLCFPTTWGLPPDVNSAQDDLAMNRKRNLQHTIFSVVSGLPEITVPVQIRSDVSLGLSLLGPRGSDMQLLNLASLLATKGLTQASTDRESVKTKF